jgi:homoserine O-acetyltransferase
MGIRRVAAALALGTLAAGTATAQPQQLGHIGDFKLESGEVIRDCRLGYRTYGAFDAERSNAVLLLTWANGTTEQLASSIGRGALVDPANYYVVTIDALSNGVSSSPSNSDRQPRMRFPKYTMSDLVRAEHELLTKRLGITHVRAVVGVSMGGMQTFQWIVSYPTFMDKAVPIAGSPRLAPYDLLHWQTQIDAIVNDVGWKNGEYRSNPARVAEAEFGALLLTTPQHYNKTTTREKVFAEIEKARTSVGGPDANNKIRQVQAILSTDVTKEFGASLERAAAAVKAKVFVIVSPSDHVVAPAPALELAKLLDANVLQVDPECGHLAPSCDGPKVNAAVAEFLAR